MSKQADKPLTLGERMLLEGNKKKQQKHEMVVESLDEEQIIEDWEALFPSPEEAKRIKLKAQQLTNAKLGKRKTESDLEYLMRVSYCDFCEIDMSLVNTTYIVEGKVSRYVELKGILFAKKYPKREFPKRLIETLESTPTYCKVRGTVDGKNFVEVEYDIPKAKALNRNYNSNPHWKYNPQKMLNKSAKGDLFDLLSDTPMTENLVDNEEAEAK